jgi:hypothetical protein
VGVVAFALFIDYLIYGVLIPLTPYAPAHATGDEGLGCSMAPTRSASSSLPRYSAISASGSATAGR